METPFSEAPRNAPSRKIKKTGGTELYMVDEAMTLEDWKRAQERNDDVHFVRHMDRTGDAE